VLQKVVENLYLAAKLRYKIKLAHVQYIGETKLMWDKFADTGANPIRYLSKNG